MADLLTLAFDDSKLANALFGPQNRHLNLLAAQSGARISNRGNSVVVDAEDPLVGQHVLNALTQLYALLKMGYPVYEQDIVRGYSMVCENPRVQLRTVFRDAVFVNAPLRTVSAKSMVQREYLDAMNEADMVFATGPAGTGKTYLAVAKALSMVLAQQVQRIVLTRPAVEAGERLGFLPGDLAEKINPYLRPLYDALDDMLPQQKIASMIEAGVIEVAPLAFMRGRTLNNAFIILDEAQNTTREQMKMFLTRLGFGSHVVVTGDISQIDLPWQGNRDSTGRSGLVHALKILKHIEGVRFVRFSEADIVRHPLVGRIVQAYEHSEVSTPR